MHPVYPGVFLRLWRGQKQNPARYSSPHLFDMRLGSHRLPAGTSSSANVSNTEHRSRDIPESFYNHTANSWMPSV